LPRLIRTFRYLQKHYSSKGIGLLILGKADMRWADMNEVKEVLEKEKVLFYNHKLGSPLTLPKDNEILVSFIGNVPQPVFREVMRRSIFPPLLEGANTTNLLRQLKKPYISVDNRQTSFPKFREDGSDSAIIEELNDVTWAIRGFPKDDSEVIGNFIIKAMNSGSEVYRYFSALGELNMLPENDQVTNGLIILANYLKDHSN
jgi:hypothetical protein